jgi:PAS domain S-box-containing protein
MPFRIPTHGDDGTEPGAAEPVPRLLSPLLLLTLLVGLASTFLLYRNAIHTDQQRIEAALQRATQALADGARQAAYMTPTLDALTQVFSVVQAQVVARGAVDAALLQAQLWQEPPPGLETTNLEYLPRIAANELADPQALRERFGNDENAGFPLVELQGGEVRPVSPRAEYFPILLEAAVDEPRATIGLDLAGDPFYATAMKQARDSGVLASDTQFPMLQSDGMLIARYLYPLYDTSEPLQSVAARREHHVGFVTAVSYFTAESMQPFLPESYQGVEATFFPRLPGDSSLPESLNPITLDDGRHYISYEVAGVPMAIATRASAGLEEALVSPTRWWVFSIGMLMTSWMSSAILWTTIQKRRIIRVVEQRTRDLAERTHSLSAVNAALRDSETRYRMLANNISDVIYTHDMDGICTYISPSVQSQIGYDEADYLGKPVYAYMTPESAARTRKAIETTVNAYRSGKSLNLGRRHHEMDVRCKDGSIKPVEITISGVYDDAGTLVAFMGVMRDVSARKQAEQEKEKLQNAYRQAQKMEAIGTLAGGIAHDFNNLLTGVIGHADLLKLEFGDTPHARHSLDVIEMAALRAKDLTSQLLGFARKGQFQLLPVEINQVVSEVISLMDRTLDRNIVISKTASRDNPVVMGDPGQISQIFLNLAVNARDAMPKGGKLSFDISLQELDPEFCRNHIELAPGEYCVITVSDTGIGIAPEKLEHIFEPFFTDKPDGKGTGLGLAMVYGVTRNHNGTVTVYSEPGKGSTFRVFLPALAGDKVQAPRPKPRTLVHGSGHVLLIDDQDIVRQIGRRMLEQLGYCVSLAEDGVSGLEVFRTRWREIDLVIIDMIMPNMGGLDCLEALRSINPDVKAVLTSGFSRDSIADKVNEEHIIGFLQKPFRLQDLSDLLASLQH